MNPKIHDICKYLRPEGGWVTNGSEYESITFLECEPFSKTEYEAAIPFVQAALDEAEAEKVAKKTAIEAKLAALGLTVDELTSLLA